MTTPFWQIRNRKFLTRKASMKGDLAECLHDLKRDAAKIHFNGKLLLDIFIADLAIDAKGMTINDKISAVKDKLSIDNISNLFKRELLKFCNNEEIKTQYVGTLSKVFYQWGVLYLAAQSLTDNTAVAAKGYIIDGNKLNTKINIYEKNGSIYIDEQTELMGLGQLDGLGIVEVTNDDKSAMMIIKNRLHLRPTGLGGMEYANTDLAIEYNSTLAQTLYDKRTIFEKIIDLINSILRFNGIDNFSFDEEPFKPSM
ncbi:hypothetical protein DGG96_19230 [Legionella qingyii]|uniref:Uncharacterized protein n=1 Tax=Legionella qingyii TaxID=2184757 RepID=A0A317U005_9GAMM|nr:hypothetical protein [Legionella qingyii]PWY54036.1 hypothetical protein DGG96_19230 [Legionella qingyii]RUR19869.1 hypothetical protein ELY20_15220 [Legionella qingyii]RUR22341.1 hypothetical protein ELY16_14925 [Legionella qingyii]